MDKREITLSLHNKKRDRRQAVEKEAVEAVVETARDACQKVIGALPSEITSILSNARVGAQHPIMPSMDSLSRGTAWAVGALLKRIEDAVSKWSSRELSRLSNQYIASMRRVNAEHHARLLGLKKKADLDTQRLLQKLAVAETRVRKQAATAQHERTVSADAEAELNAEYLADINALRSRCIADTCAARAEYENEYTCVQTKYKSLADQLQTDQVAVSSRVATMLGSVELPASIKEIVK